MRHNNIILTTLFIGLVFFGCKKYEPEILTPKITDDHLEVTPTTATFSWTLDWPGKLVSVVEVSESEDMADSRFYGSEEETNNHDFTVEVTDLKEATKYYYRFLVWNKFYVDNKFVMEVKGFTTEAYTKPIVNTASATGIGYNEATVGGDVTSDGGLDVTECGVYWGTTSNPTTKLAIGSGTGAFSRQLTGLTDNTTYYYKAYAVNSVGESCGSVMSFTTTLAPPVVGAINGVFSVSASTIVYFSQGNLQYIGSAATPYWKFAENQWDYLGVTTGQNSSSQTVDRDLFCWGTSGYNHGAVCYQPWSTSTGSRDYYAYGNYQYNLYDQTGQADWGYNAINNGGNTVNTWRTLTHEEWVYVFNTRTTTSGVRYAKAKVNNVNGVILLPDDWSSSYYSLSNTNQSGASFTSNTVTASQWSTLEQHGAVFLPAAGYQYGNQYGTSVYDGSYGNYWSASYGGYGSSAWNAYFNNGCLSTDGDHSRSAGRSVRLVRDYNP